MDGETVLETYPTAQAAELDAAYLRAHGVNSRIEGAVSGVSSAGAISGLALGELVAIRLCVSRSELEQARELLAELRKPDLRQPTFRVPSNRRLLFACIGGIGGAILAAIVAERDGALVGSIAGFIGGWLMGRRFVSYSCAASDCVGRLDADSTTCAKCGRRVAGEIAHASERLAAEEALEETRGKDAYRTEASDDGGVTYRGR